MNKGPQPEGPRKNGWGESSSSRNRSVNGLLMCERLAASEEFLEFPFRQTSVLDDAAHRECIDRIVARNRKDTLTVG